MKIAILYICTGRYIVFWQEFYKSCEEHFLKDHEKHYFVFTDGELSSVADPRIHRVEQKDMGWPDNTLKRFHLFESISSELNKYDHVFFFNANMRIESNIGNEVLLDEKGGVLVTRHPGFFNKKPREYPYERDPASRAFIASDAGSIYVQGAFNGGPQRAYLAMISALRQAIDDDGKVGKIAVWHDESHLNKYILDHSYTSLHPGYCFPQGANLPFEKKILILDKHYYGGHDYLRGLTDAPVFEKPRPTPLLVRLKRRLFGYFKSDPRRSE